MEKDPAPPPSRVPVGAVRASGNNKEKEEDMQKGDLAPCATTHAHASAQKSAVAAASAAPPTAADSPVRPPPRSAESKNPAGTVAYVLAGRVGAVKTR